jgi:hypothetical protein
MQITISKRTTRIVVVGLVVLLGLAYPTVTFAASGSPTPPSTINTCTKVRNGLYGKTKVSTTCTAGQFAQSWSQQTDSDPIFSTSATLFLSIPTNPGTPVTVATLTLPAGNYAVSGNVYINNDGVADAQVTCDINGDAGQSAFMTLAAGQIAGMPLQFATTLSGSGSATLHCLEVTSTGGLIATRAALTAIAGTSLTS